MKTKPFKNRAKYSHPFYLSMLTLLVFSFGVMAMAYAETAQKIDAGADAVMVRFYEQVKGAKFTKLDMAK